MTDSSNSIPVSNLNNPFFLETLLNDNQSNLLADLFNDVHLSYTSFPSQNPLEVNATNSATTHVPTAAPRIQDSFPVITNREVSEAGPSRRPVKRCHNVAELMESTVPSQARNTASSLTEITNPFSCSCCQVLREIIHTNGLQYHKLEVHGKIGMICHAVLHQDIQGGSSKPQTFDFSKKNIEDIKRFLENYCLKQNFLGYVLMSDPLSAYYEALCVGLEWTKTQNELLGSSFPTNTENLSNKGKELVVVNNNPPFPPLRNSYRSRAEQNFRADGMSINDFKDYFHLPLMEAARRVRLCKNVVKKICRRGKVKDWPYVTVRSAMRQITRLRTTMSPDDPVSRETTQKEIIRLKLKIVKACGGVVPTIALDI